MATERGKYEQYVKILVDKIKVRKKSVRIKK